MNLACFQIAQQHKPEWIEHGEQTQKIVWQMSYREQNAEEDDDKEGPLTNGTGKKLRQLVETPDSTDARNGGILQ
jgi:hypothetical protein